MLNEALQSENIKVHKIFYAGNKLAPEWVQEVKTALTTKGKAGSKPMFRVTDKLLNTWSDVKTSQGVIGKQSIARVAWIALGVHVDILA